jgi:hypothetical protein
MDTHQKHSEQQQIKCFQSYQRDHSGHSHGFACRLSHFSLLWLIFAALYPKSYIRVSCLNVICSVIIRCIIFSC